MNGEVYISISRMDFARLGNVKRMIHKDLGVQVSINPSGVERGTKFANADERQISQCSAFILALSAELVKSEHATFELDMAIRNNIPCLILDIDSSTLPDPTGQYASIKHVKLDELSSAMTTLGSESAPAIPEPAPAAEPAIPEPIISQKDTPDPTYTWSDEDLSTPTSEPTPEPAAPEPMPEPATPEPVPEHVQEPVIETKPEPEQPVFTSFEPKATGPVFEAAPEPAFTSASEPEPAAWQSFNQQPEEEKNVIITPVFDSKQTNEEPIDSKSSMGAFSKKGKEKMLFEKQMNTFQPSKATQRHSIGNNRTSLWIILFIVFALLIGGGTWAYFEFLHKPDKEVKNENDNENENTEQSGEQTDNQGADSTAVNNTEAEEVEVVDITTIEEEPAPQQPAPEAQPATQPSRPARSRTPARQRQEQQQPEQRIEDTSNGSNTTPSQPSRGYTLTPVDGVPANPDNNGTRQRRPYRIGN